MNDLDILAVSECSLHGLKSRIIRVFPITSEGITNALRIPGFEILLPQSWACHEMARIMLYVKSSISTKLLSTQVSTSDLPIISIEAKKGKGPKTIVSTYYREYTGGVSGLKTSSAQVDRLNRILDHWTFLDSFNLDTIILGDTNICFSKWTTTNNQQQNLINMIKESQTQLALQQLVTTETRIQLVNNAVE